LKTGQRKHGWLIGARDVEEEIVCGEPVGTISPEKATTKG
jgi:hypothetical protein